MRNWWNFDQFRFFNVPILIKIEIRPILFLPKFRFRRPISSKTNLLAREILISELGLSFFVTKFCGTLMLSRTLQKTKFKMWKEIMSLSRIWRVIIYQTFDHWREGILHDLLLFIHRAKIVVSKREERISAAPSLVSS